MTVQEALQNIKSAELGRDVRQSIHDGIKGIDDESKADMKKKQDTIDTYTSKMDLLNDKYEEQIKNLTLVSPSDAEIVDSRRTKDNTIFPTLKERLDEDKNSIWIQKQLTGVATLSETPDQLGLIKIDSPADCIIDKGTLSIIPVYKNGDGDALTGSAFTKIKKGEKLEFTIEKVYFDSLCFDILEDQGNVQGGTMETLEFPVDLNVKFSYLTATETKVNQFVGKPEELNTAAKSDLVSAVNECLQKTNECFRYANDGKSKLAAAIGNGAIASMTWDQLAGKVLKIRIDKPTTATKDSRNYTQMSVKKAFQNVIASFGECITTSTSSDAFTANVAGLSIAGGDEGGISIPSGNGSIIYTEYLVGGSFRSGTIVQIGYD